MPHDRGPTVFVVSLIVTVLASIFTLLRVISKWFVTKKTNVDDYLVVIGWVFTVALGASVMTGARSGLGKRDVEITSEMMSTLSKATYAFTVLYNPALMVTKSAILLLYIRMATAHPFLKRASIFVLTIVNLNGIVLTFLNIFQCRPIRAAFTDESGKCIDLISMYLSSAPVNILTDIAILLLPLPILTALRIEFRAKIILVATFFVGGFVAIVDVIRIVYLQDALEAERRLGKTKMGADDRPPDFIFQVSFTLMWSTVEVSVGLMCACVLVLKPLVMKVMPSLLRRRRSTSVPHPVSPIPDIPKSPRSPVTRLAPVMENPLQFEDDGAEANGPMNFMQMLAADEPPPENQPIPQSPQMPQGRRLSRKSSVWKPPSEQGDQQPTQTFFDFVEMKGKKPLVELTAREAWWPLLFVSILFFLWGFAYGLLGTLNGEIQLLMGYDPAKAIALHGAYWMGYFFSPLLVGYWTLTRGSFQITFIAGLTLYSIGALAFWPSSVLLSYPGFFISNWLIATGLACLEIAGNPFIVLAGPLHLSESRLNFSQGIQAIGSVLSPILANRVLFKNLTNDSLFNIQWCYLAVSLFVIILAVIFYYVPLSEAPDEILEETAVRDLAEDGLDPSATLRIFGAKVTARNTLLTFGVFTMALYVGSQETISYYFPTISFDLSHIDLDPFWIQAIAHAVFALGRFLASFVFYLGCPARYVLVIATFGAFLTSLLSLVLPATKGTLGAFILLSFFESPVFPTLFAVTLRNQGKRTKFVSSALVMAISGGAVFPTVAYGATLAHPTRPRYPLVITTILFGVCFSMPGWLSGGMKFWVDHPKRRSVASDREVHDGYSESGGSADKRDIALVEVNPGRTQSSSPS